MSRDDFDSLPPMEQRRVALEMALLREDVSAVERAAGFLAFMRGEGKRNARKKKNWSQEARLKASERMRAARRDSVFQEKMRKAIADRLTRRHAAASAS